MTKRIATMCINAKKRIKNFYAWIVVNLKHRKTLKRLNDNPELMAEALKQFRAKFGDNANVRTRKQWQALVRVYGIDTVCEKENMTKAEVEKRCNQSLRENIERAKRNKNLIDIHSN